MAEKRDDEWWFYQLGDLADMLDDLNGIENTSLSRRAEKRRQVGKQFRAWLQEVKEEL